MAPPPVAPGLQPSNRAMLSHRRPYDDDVRTRRTPSPGGLPVGAVFLIGLIGLLTTLLTPSPSPAAPPADPADLPREAREWLEMVHLLITPEERELYLRLPEPYLRGAFVEEFWRQRDSFETTAWTELRVIWEERAAEAKPRWGSFLDMRSQVYMLRGPPAASCKSRTREAERWVYVLRENTLRRPEGIDQGDLPLPEGLVLHRETLTLVFYARRHGEPYRLLRPAEPLHAAMRRRIPEDPLELCGMGRRSDDLIAQSLPRSPFAISDYAAKLEEFLEPPERPANEWPATFAATSTLLPEGAETFPAEAAFTFPGRQGQRAVVQGVVSVAREAVAAADFGGGPAHHLLLTGEVVREDELFDTFRYRFELPADGSETAPLPLAFQRYLRPGEFRLVLEIEDLAAENRFAKIDRSVEIPAPHETAGPGVDPRDSDLYRLRTRLLGESDAATAEGERSLAFVPPTRVVHTGYVRFSTVAVGEFDEVTFFLDDEPLMTKRRPPYSVEIDLGETPVPHRLRVAGYDAGGEEIAGDELHLNPGGQRFRVQLTEPRPGRRYEKSLRAAAQVQVPDGETLDRLEIWINERRVATLYQPPFVQPVVLAPDEEHGYVRAVAYLSDGHSTEDVVFVNPPPFLEEIDVQMVELYASVVDREGRFVPGLEEADVTVLEDGEPQTLARFEHVRELPLSTVILLDTSASMAESLGSVTDAAAAFLAETITPKDRVALIGFDVRPHVESAFTRDLDAVGKALLRLRAEGGTSLYDCLVFALSYFHGMRGQKALLLLSDGEDESSTFDFDAALDYARRAGVAVYAIGLEEAAAKRRQRKVLARIARETGGRAYFVERVEELPAIYREIERELRSRYLLAYQSESTRDPSEFRRVEVVLGPAAPGGVEVRTIAGYYP